MENKLAFLLSETTAYGTSLAQLTLSMIHRFQTQTNALLQSFCSLKWRSLKRGAGFWRWSLTFCLLLTGFQSRAESRGERYAERLANIFRPYVATLDRDLWTFRYEAKEDFRPQSQIDLQKRIGPWADRFFNPDIVLGADTGPGVYVAMDPVATATWGRTEPRLYAIKIKRGTKVLIGDQSETPSDVLRSLDGLILEMRCGATSTAADDIGHAVGFFRMNENRDCRHVVVEAIRRLGVQALSYGFSSVPVKNCRSTGTAISIISSAAISLEEINGYSDDGAIEGSPSITPFVYALFEQNKNDYYAQSLLADLPTWQAFRKAFHFFDRSPMASSEDLEKWKAEHILKCGPEWSVEDSNPVARSRMDQILKADPDVKDLLIRISLIYRSRFSSEQMMGRQETLNYSAEFNILRLKILVEQHSGSFTEANKMRYYTAQVPHWSDDGQKDKTEYTQLLRHCLDVYTNTPDFTQVFGGECGVDRD